MDGNRAWPNAMEQEQQAFTLVELISSIVILSILVGLAIPAAQHSIQAGRSTKCISNLRQLGIALNAYISENNGTMPTLQAGRRSKDEDVPVIDTLLGPYLQDSNVFLCPADHGIGAATGTSYFWNVALNGQSITNLKFMGLNTEQTRIPVLSDKQGYHPYQSDKVNVLYADGHVDKGLRFTTGK